MDKYKEMTLPQLEAAFNEKKAEFEALRAKQAPTVADLTAGQELATELTGIKGYIDAFGAGFDSLAESFADKPKDEEKSENGRAALPENETSQADVSVGDQAAAGESGDETAERARVEHEETVQEPVDPKQVDKGEVAGADGQGEPLQSASAVQTLAAKRDSLPDVPVYRQRGRATIKAASGLDTFTAGEKLDSLSIVAQGAIERVRSFPDFVPASPEVAAAGPQITKFGTATIDLGNPDELMVDERSMTPEQIDDVLLLASDEGTLEGGSLVAAGGWCAPSETVYDLTQEATTDGMLSHPEVGIRRGGLKWPLAPYFADFYANPGFKYTEAQVIAGVTKPCVTIPCPSFDEARLNVEGLCIKVDILTNVGYPEVVKNFMDGTVIAHQHWMNATKIGAMVTIAGAARVFAGLGSSVDDSLEAFELVANQTRQKYRLSLNSTLEAVLPYWTKDMFKADLRRRTGQLTPVSDQQVNALFAAMKVKVQFVYDWQDLDLTAEVYPATFNALVYPAGTFIFGTAPVINLSTIYDAASLAANQYTGLFTEQGWLVAKRRFHADLLTLPVCNAGRRGAQNFTCA